MWKTKSNVWIKYASLISDLFFGVLCSLLSLLHYFGIGKYCEKVTGIIGLACGIIGFILTLIYIIFSGYIFTHDGPGKKYGYSGYSLLTMHYNIDLVVKLNKDRAVAEWDGNKYKCLYYDEDNLDLFFAKYSDLGKKQYNYHKEFEFSSEYKVCRITPLLTRSTLSSINQKDSIIGYCQSPYSLSSNKVGDIECKYIYFFGNSEEDDNSNKYLYDKWVTSIIFGCFIIALNLGLAIFGFLLFSQNDSSSGNVAVK